MTPAYTPDRRPWRDMSLEVWVTVAEFDLPGPPGVFWIGDLDALIDELALWQPTGLWSDDRYAIQLHIAAADAHSAISVALEYHRLASEAVGLPPSRLLRVEVLTAQELERGWDECDESDAGTSTLATSGPEGPGAQACDATRALLAATTPAEIGRIVDDFVAEIGAVVIAGPSRGLDSMTTVALEGAGGRTRHATAEAVSMAGLLLECALPTLMVDAQRALARLQRRPAGGGGAAEQGADGAGRAFRARRHEH